MTGSQQSPSGSGDDSPLTESYQQQILRENLQVRKEAQEKSIKRALLASIEEQEKKREALFETLSGSYEESRMLLDEVDSQLSLAAENKQQKTYVADARSLA